MLDKIAWVAPRPRRGRGCGEGFLRRRDLMTSKPVSEMMIDLGLLRSYSRPRTSNDNPYSEVQFKTLKYVPDFPDRFGCLADARVFCDRFSPPITTSTATPGSGCTPRPRSTSEPRSRSALAPDHPRPCPRTTPRAVQPPAPAATPARAGVDQPTRPVRATR
jgi:putative transposase